ncbi:portal protein [Turicimonas muris]|uniref:portal protein n=1 Tax=Turicimonas muris TaxID=1796652 RepID=UPI0032B3033C
MPLEENLPVNGAINPANVGVLPKEGLNQAEALATNGSEPMTSSPVLLGPDGRPAGSVSIGGIMEIKSAAQLIAEEQAKAQEENSEPMIQGLAAYIQKCWSEAKSAKETTVEPRMLKSLRQRRGEYDPDLKAHLQEQGSALVYMMLTSNKCRSAAAWLREALADMPWECEPTPVADIDPKTQQMIFMTATQAAMQSVAVGGYVPKPVELAGYMLAMKDSAMVKVQEIVKKKAELMTRKMKDQMTEGGFQKAIEEFIDDLVTFPAACFKGPVVRSKPALKWKQGPNGSFTTDVQQEFLLEWERVDPFNLYPAPDASGVDDGYLIERHKLSRQDLVALKGVEGYSEASINAILAEYYQTGLERQISIDSERDIAEGRDGMPTNNPSRLIEALQFWGSVNGQMLLDWGMDEAEIEGPLDEYHIEAWLIGNYVIKATINPDPLHRKPYYKTSWENVPGCFWGNSVPDLCRDAQAVCNAAARALVNNMGLASGPQVMVNTSRLPEGDTITTMYPWKIWLYEDDGYGSNGSMAPVSFFQPGSNSQELMQIYQQFSVMADEYTGIPRYMTGDAATGGAGRTASGLSMLMSNAGRTIKGVISSIDRVLEPAIERLYVYNMQFLDDPDLKGDLKIVARGATALVMKEQQQQRVNEVFQMCLQSPVLQQIVGPTGIAYLFRNVLERLNINADELVPSPEILKVQQAQQQAQMMQAQQQAAAQEQQRNGQPDSGGSPAKPENRSEGKQLMDGTPQAGQ